LANLAYKTESRGPRIEFKDFIIIFATFAILIVLAIERVSIARQRVTKYKVEKTVAHIIKLERSFYHEQGRFGALTETGFENPFLDNSVEFVISTDPKGFFVQASENPLIDAFGDGIPGNEYFVGYANGSIEYNRKH
jgi:hypothetical protein